MTAFHPERREWKMEANHLGNHKWHIIQVASATGIMGPILAGTLLGALLASPLLGQSAPNMSGTWKRAEGSDVSVRQNGGEVTVMVETSKGRNRVFTGTLEKDGTVSLTRVPKRVEDIGEELPEDVRSQLIFDRHYFFRGGLRWLDAEKLELALFEDDVDYDRFSHVINSITLSNSPERIVLTRAKQEIVPIASDLLFDFDGYGLKPGAAKVLAALKSANIDSRPGWRISVEGHCDDAGSDAYNLELSRKRAQAVADWLTANGVSPALVTIQAYGKSKPLYPNDSAANRARNRRVALVLSE
jgi:outer membrane protein OmpA-like peptidoglycan-associated protein